MQLTLPCSLSSWLHKEHNPADPHPHCQYLSTWLHSQQRLMTRGGQNAQRCPSGLAVSEEECCFPVLATLLRWQWVRRKSNPAVLEDKPARGLPLTLWDAARGSGCQPTCGGPSKTSPPLHLDAIPLCGPGASLSQVALCLIRFSCSIETFPSMHTCFSTSHLKS